MQTPDIALLGGLAALLLWVFTIYVESFRTRLALHLCLGIPVAWALGEFLGMPATYVFVGLLVLGNLGAGLAMRSWKARRRAEDAYWAAAGTLAGSIARAHKS